MISLSAKQAELISDLNVIEDAHERLSALTSYIPRTKLPEESKTEELIVAGCLSRVWIYGDMRDGLTHFRGAADSPMVAGLIALLCDLYSESLPAEVVAVEPEVWQRCGFLKILTPTRVNGLAAVRRRISEMAESWA